MSKKRGRTLTLGVIIGFFIGLFLAPKKGTELRQDAKKKIDTIKENPKDIIFKFADGDSDYKRIFKVLISKYKDSVVLKFGSKPYFAFKLKDIKKEEKLEFLRQVFNDIIL